MAVYNKIQVPLGTSLKSLIKGFVLTKQTEDKSPRTVEYYQENLKRFLWYAEKKNWPDDIRLLNEWHIREFLGYVATETHRWGISGNGSETSRHKASHSTVHHYYRALSCFFTWAVSEGLMNESPMAKIKVAKPKAKVVQPYTSEEIKKMLAVCEYDYEHNAKFLASRNQAIILMLLDTGVRLSELLQMEVGDIENETGYIKVLGKGAKERVVRIGKTSRKALWRYLMYRPDNGKKELWLTEEGEPLHESGLQSLVKRLEQRAGITSRGSVHRFRHTFALDLIYHSSYRGRLKHATAPCIYSALEIL